MHNAMNNRYIRAALCLLISFFLNACSDFSQGNGFDSVKATVKQQTGRDIEWQKTADAEEDLGKRIDILMGKPLDIDAAVEVALLNNKRLRASFYDLGISQADLVQAGRLPNPRFAMLYARNSGDYKIEQALTFNIFSLFTMPKAKAIEQQRFELTQKEVAQDVLRLAREVRIAWVQAVSANESLRYMTQVKVAAEASAELANRMTIAGNWSQLDRAREQGFYAEAMLEYSHAKNAQTISREQLVRLLSLSGDQRDFVLAERLPDLPQQPDALPDAEKEAMQQRLDLQIVRMETDRLAKALGLTRTTRFINVLELGPARVLEGGRGEPYKNGVEIAFELPLFDWGEARVAKAEARYMQALNQAAQQVVNAQSEVRQSYAIYRTHYDITKHYRDEIVPLKKTISAENQLRYNGMLVSVFDLLADARTQISSVNQYIQSLRDFWIAQSDLQMSLIGSIASNEKEAQ
ncbi:MAG: TolC family protein [Methylophilaceae bacterium]